MEENVCVDELALKYVTDSLLAQERVSWVVGQKDSTFDELVKTQTHDSLHQLRALKSHLDGSGVDFESPVIQEDGLTELKLQVLMHTPGTMKPWTRTDITHRVQEVMKGQCKEIVCISLLTCPWYEKSQKERGEQAKHNILIVIFTSFDEQFFAPANPQIKEKASIIDLGWFLAVELSHFGQALAKGRSRYIEVVYPRQGALVWAADGWDNLQSSLPFSTVSATRGFLEACLGQATGGISKKKKDGNLKMRDGSSVFEVGQSLRLLQLAELAAKGTNPATMEIVEAELSDFGRQALSIVETLYDHPDTQGQKRALFELILIWVKHLRSEYKSSQRQTSATVMVSETVSAVGRWLMAMRLDGREVAPLKVLEDEHSRLVGLMQKVGGPVSKMLPEQIVLIAIAGSRMYNLATPTSDIDYLVVFQSKTETVLSATSRPQESFENKGIDKQIEYGVEEIRAFAETLLKCSVVSLELVYATDHEYSSPVWKELCKDREKFVNERAIQQYVGLIKNNFRFIEKGRHSDDPKKERKLFYKIFHKLHALEDMMHGRVPEVRLEGAIREFVMNVRNEDEGEWSRDSVMAKSIQEYTAMRERLCRRTHRLKENTDYTLVTSWLMKARNVLS